MGDTPFLRDVMPGEVLKIDNNGITSIFVHPKNQLSLCTFEILYFANENSFIDGYCIKDIRKQLAIKLAKREEFTEKDYIVIGIPSTGMLLGQSYANVLGLDYRQWITKNPNIDRTFILKTDKERKEACMKKFFYDRIQLKGKKVIIVDDTIVRGNVIGSIIENLRNIGVSEVHVRIPAPPVVEKCILGISIQHKKELIATNRNVKEVSKKINADSLSYLSLYDISDMVPPKSYNLCFSGYVDKNIISCSNEDLQKNGFNNKNGPSLFL